MRKKSMSNNSYDMQKPVRQVAYQRTGSQKEGSPDYVLLYSEDENEEEKDHLPMKTRKSTLSVPRKVEVIHVQVQSEDTLQALALRYYCTISELKRINQIHKDNEIFAHRFIKVPVKPYSLLTETDHSNLNTKPDSICLQSEENSSKTNQDLIDLLQNTATQNVDINKIILNSTVGPLVQENCYQSEEILEDTETDHLIISPNNQEINNSSNIVSIFKCSGADWGLSWFQLLCFSLLLCFAAPIIYIFYIAESSKHGSHNTMEHDHA